MGFGAVGIGTPVGGSESEGWALHRGLPPVVHREPNKTPKTGMSPHIGGDLLSLHELGRLPLWGREGVLATTGPPKKDTTKRIGSPLTAPLRGGILVKGGRRPFLPPLSLAPKPARGRSQSDRGGSASPLQCQAASPSPRRTAVQLNGRPCVDGRRAGPMGADGPMGGPMGLMFLLLAGRRAPPCG